MFTPALVGIEAGAYVLLLSHSRGTLVAVAISPRFLLGFSIDGYCKLGSSYRPVF